MVSAGYYRLNKIDTHTVTILPSGGTETAKDRAKGLYDEDHMVKPVQVSVLIEKIDDMLARGSRQAKKEPR